MAKTINTRVCKKCSYCVFDDSDKSKVTIYCEMKEKKFIYGQRIVCEYYDKKETEDDN